MSKRPRRRHEVIERKEAVVAGARETSEGESVVRGRPGRRTVKEQQEAVRAVLGGKASVDQVARRFGVLPATVEGWRQDVLAGVGEALRRGSASSSGRSSSCVTS